MFEKADQEEGSGPLKLFLLRCNRIRGKADQDDGSGPLKELPLSHNFCRFGKAAHSLGKGPLKKEFWPSLKSARYVKATHSKGRLPLKKLSFSLKSSIFVMADHCVGKGPLKEF